MACNAIRMALVALLFASAAHGASIEQPLADAAQEQTARSLFHEIKCVVCEGQSLAESDATLAKQMRAHIRTMLAQGKSERQILRTFRDTYGKQILLTTPLEKETAILWCAPLILLGAGGLLVWRTTRHAGASV